MAPSIVRAYLFVRYFTAPFFGPSTAAAQSTKTKRALELEPNPNAHDKTTTNPNMFKLEIDKMESQKHGMDVITCFAKIGLL